MKCTFAYFCYTASCMLVEGDMNFTLVSSACRILWSHMWLNPEPQNPTMWTILELTKPLTLFNIYMDKYTRTPKWTVNNLKTTAGAVLLHRVVSGIQLSHDSWSTTVNIWWTLEVAVKNDSRMDSN
jgi:hypothetical protein